MTSDRKATMLTSPFSLASIKSEDVAECRIESEDVAECRIKSEDVAERRRMSQNVAECRRVSLGLMVSIDCRNWSLDHIATHCDTLRRLATLWRPSLRLPSFF